MGPIVNTGFVNHVGKAASPPCPAPLIFSSVYILASKSGEDRCCPALPASHASRSPWWRARPWPTIWPTSTPRWKRPNLITGWRSAICAPAISISPCSKSTACAKPGACLSNVSPASGPQAFDGVALYGIMFTGVNARLVAVDLMIKMGKPDAVRQSLEAIRGDLYDLRKSRRHRRAGRLRARRQCRHGCADGLQRPRARLDEIRNTRWRRQQGLDLRLRARSLRRHGGRRRAQGAANSAAWSMAPRPA